MLLKPSLACRAAIVGSYVALNEQCSRKRGGARNQDYTVVEASNFSRMLSSGSIYFSSNKKQDDSMKISFFQSLIRFAANASVGGVAIVPSNRTLMEQSRPHEQSRSQKQKQSSIVDSQVYDFVVIGNGNAGRSAVQELQQRCPDATIALVDPLLHQQEKAPQELINDSQKQTKRQQKQCVIDFYSLAANAIDPKRRLVQLFLPPNNDGAEHFNDTATFPGATTTLEYRYAALIATGARGAPPPHYLVDERAWSRVWELRPTVLPPPSTTIMTEQYTSQDQPLKAMTTTTTTTTTATRKSTKPITSLVYAQQRPYIATKKIRDGIVRAAQQGKNVGILGCGWDAIDLAISSALATSPSSSTNSNRGRQQEPEHEQQQQQQQQQHTADFLVRGRRRRGGGRTALIFGSGGPVDHVLPHYLSNAVTKRLKSKRIDIMDRTLIRYVNFDEITASSNDGENTKEARHRLGLYTAKSYDLLDTQRKTFDCLVLAPEVLGSRGTAFLPTNRIPQHLQRHQQGEVALTAEQDDHGSNAFFGRPWYETWSHFSTASKSSSFLTESPMVVCYQDDGRVAVNAELCACTGIYAAGSVAKCPNVYTGQAQVAGYGAADAQAAGRVAAANMAQLYNQKPSNLFLSLTSRHNQHYPENKSTSTINSTKQEYALLADNCQQVHDPFPLWRSDYLSYDSTTSSSLSRVGISALCLGDCDAERLSTYGVWWTNQAAQQRFIQEYSTALSSVNKSSNKTKAEEEEERTLRERAKYQVTKPVYGIGVVYYLDQTNRIQGIMLWGLPYTTESGDIASNKNKISTTSNRNTRLTENLKEPLIRRLREILRSNGRDAKTYEYFTNQSRHLVLTAFSSMGDFDQVLREKHVIDFTNFPKPLHRLASPSGSVLARSRRGPGKGTTATTGNNGDSLFARSEHTSDVPHTEPPPKPMPGIGFSDASNPSFKAAEQLYEYQLWEQRAHQWDDNEVLAIPPKEDALWIRKGYEDRNTSAREQSIDMLNKALGRRNSSAATATGYK